MLFLHIPWDECLTPAPQSKSTDQSSEDSWHKSWPMIRPVDLRMSLQKKTLFACTSTFISPAQLWALQVN